MAAPDPRQGQAVSREEAEQEIQRLLTYGEQVRAELGAVEEQRQMLTDVLADYRRGREALKALADGADTSDVLVPLGGGTYVSANLSTSGKVLMGLGSGVHAEGTVQSALERLETREESAAKARDRLAEEARKLSEEMTRLNQHLQALSMGGAHDHEG